MGHQYPLNLIYLQVQWLCKVIQLNSDLVCPMYRQLPLNHAQFLEII